MARGWRVLDATSSVGLVRGQRGGVVFADDHGVEHVVPASEIALLLVGQSTTVASSAIHYLSQHDVVLLYVDWRGIPYAGLYPWMSHGRVAARHLAQASLTLPRRKNAWQQVVRAKVDGQARALKWSRSSDDGHLMRLVGQVRSGDSTHVEAQAARYYWRHLFGVGSGFVRERDGDDPRNALLNYGYTILRGYGIRAVLAAGLSPPIGLFHRGRSNYFNLVDDLIEPFRPLIDVAVVKAGPGAAIEDSHVKRAMVAAASGAYAADGRKIPAVLEDLAQQVGRYVEGDLERLSVERWQAPVEHAERWSPAEASTDEGEFPW